MSEEATHSKNIAPLTHEEKERVSFLWVKIGDLLDKESLRVSLVTITKVRDELFEMFMQEEE